MFDSPKWIWLENSAGVNQYVEFRYEFEIDSSFTDLLAYISVDSDYEFLLNGQFAGCNQYPNWPQEKTYNCHAVSKFLKAGRNCIAIRVYYRGENFAVYAKGMPGLIFSLVNNNKQEIVSSENKWKCRLSQSYKSGSIAKVTAQVGFTAEYHADSEDAWKELNYDDSTWQNAVELCDATDGYWKSLVLRPLKYLDIGTPKPAKLIASGYILRQGESATVAETMMNDAMIGFPLHDSLDYKGQTTPSRLICLPSEDGKPMSIDRSSNGRGVYLVFDLGCEEAGLLNLEIDAQCGTILDIAHGEHLDDLRVRAAVGGRNFADRYVCGSGKQSWLFPYRRLGCRYLEVHIPELKEPIKIYSITVRPVTYPFAGHAEFTCSDSKFNDIWNLSKRTLQLCAHEHYEDCPWREQALYGCDSRLQALFGYYSLGEYEFPSVCFDLLGAGIRDDDLLELTAPARIPVDIPGFSLHWVMELWELFLYSGMPELVSSQSDRICRILDRALSRMTSQGVVANSQNPDHFHFYEWTEGGLEGDLFGALEGRPQEFTLDAAYNLTLIGALRAACSIGRYINNEKLIKYGESAEKIRKSIHGIFWNEQRGCYASFCRKANLSNYAQLTQALAIIEGVIPDKEKINQLCTKLKEDKSLIRAELSSLLFVYEALLKNDKENLSYVLSDLKDKFGKMLYVGATSLWETVDGGEAFSRAGSLCHGWSSVFNYIAGAYILGVKPLEPGFKRFSFKPAVGYLPNFRGCVPTQHGLIEINVQQDSIDLKKPQQLTTES